MLINLFYSLVLLFGCYVCFVWIRFDLVDCSFDVGGLDVAMLLLWILWCGRGSVFLLAGLIVVYGWYLR